MLPFYAIFIAKVNIVMFILPNWLVLWVLLVITVVSGLVIGFCGKAILSKP